MRFADDVADAQPTAAPPRDDELRDAAIRAFTDAVERPHGGRVGEALDGIERWLRVSLRER